jgi:hypothetical protein
MANDTKGADEELLDYEEEESSAKAAAAEAGGEV